MAQKELLMKLAAILSLFGMSGCSSDSSGVAPPPQATYTAEDHDRLYTEGVALIRPYMQLGGGKARPADTDSAREELQRGISRLQEVVKLRPANWAAYWILGKGYQALHDSEHALDAFGKAFAIKRDNPDVAREYMIECLNLGRFDEGISAAERGVELSPSDSGLKANLALAYLLSGRLDDALAYVNKSLETAPNDAISLQVKKLILEVREGKRTQPTSMRDLQRGK